MIINISNNKNENNNNTEIIKDESLDASRSTGLFQFQG